MKKVYISGQSGFVGTHLSEYLTAKGYEVIPIDRKAFQMTGTNFLDFISEASVIINLAGAPIIKRWTKAYKKELMASRIFTTRKLAQAISLMSPKPEFFLSVSAVGIYNDKGRKTEESIIEADTFLTNLCVDWESEALAAASHTKLAICRMGIVLGKDGGMLKTVLPIFKNGFGGTINHGRQFLSWVHIDDVIAAIDFIIENKKEGVFNFTAPNPVTNRTFTKTLATALKKPAFLPVPGFMLKLIYGDGASILLNGQEVYPEKLLKNGFEFKYPKLNEALENLLS